MRNLYKIFIPSLVLILLMNNAYGQDPIFGQFYRASTHLNPAMSGIFEGQFRIQANYRQQWSSILPNNPFQTIGASFEWKERVGQNDFAAFSFTALRDQAGSSNFTINRGNLGFSYLKQLSGSRRSAGGQYLIAGAQFGFGQHAVNPDKLWFSEQYDETSETVNFGTDNGENFSSNSTDVYLDFNAGLLWYAIWDDNFSMHAGGALQHLTEPEISFLGNSEEKLPRRYVIHGGAELPFNRQLSILPAAMMTFQGSSTTFITGANLRFTNRDRNEVALRAGIWGQVSNKLEDKMLFHSLIFNAILEMERWSIGISYDVNTSSVSDLSNGRGAYELSFIYTQPAKYRERIKCPKY